MAAKGKCSKDGKNKKQPDQEEETSLGGGAKALENWDQWMAERKNIYARLSNKLGVIPKNLVMNSAEFRQKKILHRAVIERAKHPLTFDKYRGNPEFWEILEGVPQTTVPRVIPTSSTEPGAQMTKEEVILPMLAPSSKGRKLDYKNPEYIGTPRNILVEKGIGDRDTVQRPRKNEDEKWMENPYLHQKVKKLPKPLRKIIRNNPDIENLYIVGKDIKREKSRKGRRSILSRSTSEESDSGTKESSTESQSKSDDKETGSSEENAAGSGVEGKSIHTIPEEIECVKINGEIMQSRRLKEEQESLNEQEISVDIEKTIEFAFDGKPNEELQKTMIIENHYSLDVHYAWYRQQKTYVSKACLNLPKSEEEKPRALKIKNMISSIRPEYYSDPKFFFNKLKGTLKPTKAVEIPIFFRSKEDGFFSEKWLLQIDPPLIGSNRFGEMEVFLVGFVSLPAQENKLSRIQMEIEKRCAEFIARRKMNNVIEKVTKPKEQYGDGPAGPSSLLINPKSDIEQRDIFKEKEIFHWANPPQYYYHPSIIKNLKGLHRDITRKYGKETQWNLSISQLREIIVKMKNREVKSRYLDTFCTNVDALLEPYIENTMDDKKYYLVYNILCKFIDIIECEIEVLQTKYEITRFQSKSELEQHHPITMSPSTSSTARTPEEQDGTSASKLKSADDSHKLYLQAAYAKVYGQLLRTVDNICICLESTKNKYLIDRKWDDFELKKF